MKFKILTVLALAGFSSCYSQVGINTANPQGIFHVDAGKDNPISGTPSAAQQANDVTVTASGNLGVGINNPVLKFHAIAATADNNRFNLFDAPASTSQAVVLSLRNTSPIAAGNFALLGFTNNGTNGGGANWGVGSIRTGASDTMGSEENFYIGNSTGGIYYERFRITALGNVGINTSSPQRRLHVDAASGPLRFENLASSPANLTSTLAIDSNGEVYKNTTISITAGGNVGINTSSPQRRLHVDANSNPLRFDNLAGSPPNLTSPIAIDSNGDVYKNGAISITSAGYVGINTSSPQRYLQVNANSNPIRLENLPNLPTNTTTSSLVIDANGDVYKNNTVSVEGQILRLGLNNTTYSAGSESALRFNNNDDSISMGNAPNSAPNFINTIIGATITAAVSATAGQGSPSRTTDRITLQPGVYKVQVRLVGNFGNSNNSNNVFLKSIVNNNEYSLVNLSNSSNQTNTWYFDDFINITSSAQTVDFTISPMANSFTVATSQVPSSGSGNSYRSLILIQRLR